MHTQTNNRKKLKNHQFLIFELVCFCFAFVVICFGFCQPAMFSGEIERKMKECVVEKSSVVSASALVAGLTISQRLRNCANHNKQTSKKKERLSTLTLFCFVLFCFWENGSGWGEALDWRNYEWFATIS